MKLMLKVLIVPILLAMCAGSLAEAQVLIQVSRLPGGGTVTVTGSLLASSSLTSTKLRLTYPGPIPGSPVVSVQGASGLFSTVTVNSFSALGIIEVQLPGVPLNSMNGSFLLSGVPVPPCGQPVLGLDSLANNYILSNSTIDAAPPLVITSAVEASPGVLTIRGTNLCSPSVLLEQTPLPVVAALPSGDEVSVLLPSGIPPGSYLLTLSRGLLPEDLDTFSVAIGYAKATSDDNDDGGRRGDDDDDDDDDD